MMDFQPLDGWNFSLLGQSLFEQIELHPNRLSVPLTGLPWEVVVILRCPVISVWPVTEMKISHPGAKLGIITGFCGTQKLPRMVGSNRAKEIFMTSRVYSAEQALQIKLVEQVYPAAAFMEQVLAYAGQIASQPPMALTLAKKMLNSAENVSLSDGQVMELGAFASLFPRAGTMERIDDFLMDSRRLTVESDLDIRRS